MHPNLALQPIAVATGSADVDGRLVLADGRLVAVLVHLQDEAHGECRGAWFLEAGFGDLAGGTAMFRTLDDALEWMLRRLMRSLTRPASAPPLNETSSRRRDPRRQASANREVSTARAPRGGRKARVAALPPQAE